MTLQELLNSNGLFQRPIIGGSVRYKAIIGEQNSFFLVGAANDDGARRTPQEHLMLAVLYQSLTDVLDGDPDVVKGARQWVSYEGKRHSDHFLFSEICEHFDIDVESMRKRILGVANWARRQRVDTDIKGKFALKEVPELS